MMVEEKIYEIAGVKCRLNLDQTLRESFETEELLNNSGLVKDDLERLLGLILKPVSATSVDVLEMKESQAQEVIGEYLVAKKKWRDALKNDSVRLMTEQIISGPKSGDLPNANAAS